MRFLAVLVFTLAVVPFVASADTIHGCVNQKNGKLRIVGDPVQCKAGKEGAISWNSEGPAGPPGEGICGEATPFQLVGFTTGTYQGNGGVIGYTAACQAEFPGSRFCSADDILATTTVPTIVPAVVNRAWVHNGHKIRGGSTYNCEGWLNNAGNNGYTVMVDGRTYGEDCGDFFHVACCAPVPAE